MMTNPYSPNQDSTNSDVTAYPQAQYTPAPQQATYGYQQTNEDSLINGNSTKAWVVNLLLESILGFIWLIIILVSNEQSQSRKNYVKARLIVFAIMVVLTILFFTVFGSAIAALLNDAQHNSVSH